jgi:hypothetical protein
LNEAKWNKRHSRWSGGSSYLVVPLHVHIWTAEPTTTHPKKNTINKETKRENVLLMCDGTSFFIFGFIFHVWWNLSRTVISSRLCHSVKRAALLRLLLRPQQQQQQLYTLHRHPFTLGRGRSLSASILSGFIRRLLERDRWEKGIEHRRWDGKPTDRNRVM